MLMRPEYRPDLNPKYKKKIEQFVIKHAAEMKREKKAAQAAREDQLQQVSQ